MRLHSELSLRKPTQQNSSRVVFYIVKWSYYWEEDAAIATIANRDQHQVGVLTSVERDNTLTSEICCSTADNSLPPMLMLPWKRKQQEFQIGFPPDGCSKVNDCGWMTVEVFLEWFEKCMEFFNAKNRQPSSFFFYGHAFHTKNLGVIDLPGENSVIVLCFPSQCSHRLQPRHVAAPNSNLICASLRECC